MQSDDTRMAGYRRDYVKRAEASLRQVLLVARLEPTGALSGRVPLQHNAAKARACMSMTGCPLLQKPWGRVSEPAFSRSRPSCQTQS